MIFDGEQLCIKNKTKNSMYKLKISYKGKFIFAKYFDSKKEAIKTRERALDCLGYTAKLQAKKVELVNSHSALCKGYLKKGCKYTEYYDGKFGVGYIEHVPNCESVLCHNNNYHVIRYYIEK